MKTSSVNVNFNLDPKICQLLIDEFNDKEYGNPSILARTGNTGDFMTLETIKNVRNSCIKFLDRNHWAYGLCWHYVNCVNNEFWKYDLYSVETVQLTKYVEGGFYAWHIDSGMNNNEEYLVMNKFDQIVYGDRKLSVTIQLNDPSEYEGGILELFDPYIGTKITAPSEKGHISVFESHTRHRVTKVKKGVRYSLVAWINGPLFK